MKEFIYLRAGEYTAIINPFRGANCISLRHTGYGASILREPNYDSGNYFSPSYTTTTYNISSTGSYERLSYQFYNIDNTIVEFDVDSKDIYDFEDLEDLAKDLGLED